MVNGDGEEKALCIFQTNFFDAGGIPEAEGPEIYTVVQKTTQVRSQPEATSVKKVTITFLTSPYADSGKVGGKGRRGHLTSTAIFVLNPTTS